VIDLARLKAEGTVVEHRSLTGYDRLTGEAIARQSFPCQRLRCHLA